MLLNGFLLLYVGGRAHQIGQLRGLTKREHRSCIMTAASWSAAASSKPSSPGWRCAFSRRLHEPQCGGNREARVPLRPQAVHCLARWRRSQLHCARSQHGDRRPVRRPPRGGNRGPALTSKCREPYWLDEDVTLTP